VTEKDASKKKRRSDGEVTERRIYEEALALFRKKGFQQTTMRDIATAAGMSTGAAYHYFQSKSAIVLAFYEKHTRGREEALRRILEEEESLESRLSRLMHEQLEGLTDDRPLLSALTASVINTADPLSIFSKETRHLTQASLDAFRAPLAGSVPDDLVGPIAGLLWALQLGLLLYFIHDDSSGQQRTHALVDEAIGAICSVLPLLGSPLFEGHRKRGLLALDRAGLLRWLGDSSPSE